MARNNNRGRGGRSDQPLFSDWMDTAKDRPMATAAAAAAAVGAGVFLWSRRNQISDQLSQLSNQISDWTESMRSGGQGGEFETTGAMGSLTSTSSLGSASTGASKATRATGTRSSSSRGRTSRKARGMSETGGGNASLGAHSGTTGTDAGS